MKRITPKALLELTRSKRSIPWSEVVRVLEDEYNIKLGSGTISNTLKKDTISVDQFEKLMLGMGVNAKINGFALHLLKKSRYHTMKQEIYSLLHKKTDCVMEVDGIKYKLIN
ncbi:MAG: hypothetical protein COA36_16880 [Desulfotalea sp.]|nr:MAG: hypothetical protein COA36_16880 [Desulfotalea sp.]